MTEVGIYKRKQENKKGIKTRFWPRKNEKTIAAKKKRKNTRSWSRKKEINQDLDQEKKTSFKILFFFFYKFPPQLGTCGSNIEDT